MDDLARHGTDESGTSADFTPMRILEVDISEALPDLTLLQPESGLPYARARVLVRLHTHPLGFVDLLLIDGGLPADILAAAIWDLHAEAINMHLRDDGRESVATLDARGLPSAELPHCLRERVAFLVTAPFVSVVIATRDRAERLADCLDTVLALEYPRYEVIVVDNAPTSAATAELVATRSEQMSRLRYVREDRPGLSWARMCGFAHACGDIVAFTDDDVSVDRHWLAALAQGFTRVERVGCVTGAVIPKEIETIEQQWCEERGGFTKGFTRQIFDLHAHRRAELLYPLRASMFGTGANAAFDVRALREVGGLDVMMGAGTPTRGGEDLDIYFRIVDRDYRLVYEPAALVHHLHHRGYRALRNQSYSYGVALTAYLAKCVVQRPRRILKLARAIPYGIRYALSPRSPKNRHKQAHYPRELSRIELRGMLEGPLAYLRSRRAYRRMENGALGVR